MGSRRVIGGKKFGQLQAAGKGGTAAAEPVRSGAGRCGAPAARGNFIACVSLRGIKCCGSEKIKRSKGFWAETFRAQKPEASGANFAYAR